MDRKYHYKNTEWKACWPKCSSQAGVLTVIEGNRSPSSPGRMTHRPAGKWWKWPFYTWETVLTAWNGRKSINCEIEGSNPSQICDSGGSFHLSELHFLFVGAGLGGRKQYEYLSGRVILKMNLKYVYKNTLQSAKHKYEFLYFAKRQRAFPHSCA